MTPVIVLLLLCPVVVCYNITSLTAKLSVVVLTTSMFVMVLSTLTKAKTTELAVGGATYVLDEHQAMVSLTLVIVTDG